MAHAGEPGAVGSFLRDGKIREGGMFPVAEKIKK